MPEPGGFRKERVLVAQFEGSLLGRGRHGSSISRHLLTVLLSESREEWMNAGAQFTLSLLSPLFLQSGTPAMEQCLPYLEIFLPHVENSSQTHPEVCLFDDSRLCEDGN